MPTVGLLATGDELVNGDILNTNGQAIANTLFELGFDIKYHLTVKDGQQDLLFGFNTLLQTTDIIISIGGLGPTSDDRTRFALAEATDQPLIFDSNSWDHIVNRLQFYNLTIPESNKVQALFPKGAIVLHNENGTANGCFLPHGQQQVFMLPGPPNECLPLFYKAILPRLENQVKEKYYKHSWLLLGVSEGHVASQLDELVDDPSVQIGYRVYHPYLEVKLLTNDQHALASIKAKLLPIIEKNVVSENKLNAIETLQRTVNQLKIPLVIEDQATRGLLEAELVNPDNSRKITFQPLKAINSNTACLAFQLSGLEAWWQQTSATTTEFTLSFYVDQRQVQHHVLAVPNRAERCRTLAVAMAAHLMNQWLLHHMNTSDANS